MSVTTLLILLAAICFFIAAVVWERVSDRVPGVNIGWLGLFLFALSYLIK